MLTMDGKDSKYLLGRTVQWGDDCWERWHINKPLLGKMVHQQTIAGKDGTIAKYCWERWYINKVLLGKMVHQQTIAGKDGIIAKLLRGKTVL
jgi:hypothetical protein